MLKLVKRSIKGITLNTPVKNHCSIEQNKSFRSQSFHFTIPIGKNNGFRSLSFHLRVSVGKSSKSFRSVSCHFKQTKILYDYFYSEFWLNFIHIPFFWAGRTGIFDLAQKTFYFSWEEGGKVVNCISDIPGGNYNLRFAEKK